MGFTPSAPIIPRFKTDPSMAPHARRIRTEANGTVIKFRRICRRLEGRVDDGKIFTFTKPLAITRVTLCGIGTLKGKSTAKSTKTGQQHTRWPRILDALDKKNKTRTKIADHCPTSTVLRIRAVDRVKKSLISSRAVFGMIMAIFAFS